MRLVTRNSLRPSSVRTIPPQINQGAEVSFARQPLRHEPPHLAGRSRIQVQTVSVYDSQHRRVERKSLSVVHILISGQASKHRLTEQPLDQVLDILAAPGLVQYRPAEIGQAENFVQFAMGQEPSLGDLAAVKFQLQATVEIEPQRGNFDSPIGHVKA